jgi:hypothetical protein
MSLLSASVCGRSGLQTKVQRQGTLGDRGFGFAGAQDEPEVQVFSRVLKQIDVSRELGSNFNHDQFLSSTLERWRLLISLCDIR